MIFNANIVNHTNPAVSLQVADSGVPPLTYNQIKNSLGNQVYNIQGLYLYSTNVNQLLGVIQYQRYDSTGEQSYRSVALTIDPYQGTNALDVDLRTHSEFYILNGNSSLSFTMLPNADLIFKTYNQRIKNTLGDITTNFKAMEEIFKPYFFENYKGEEDFEANYGKEDELINKTTTITKPLSYKLDSTPIVFVSAFAIGLILLSKK